MNTSGSIQHNLHLISSLVSKFPNGTDPVPLSLCPVDFHSFHLLPIKNLEAKHKLHQNTSPRAMETTSNREYPQLSWLFAPSPPANFGQKVRTYYASNIVISSPDLAKEIMKTHDITFAQRPFLLAATVATYNYTDIAFSPYGDYWRQIRKICTVELLTAAKEMVAAAGGFSLADLYPSIKLFQAIGGMGSRLESLHKTIDKIFESIIDEHRAKRSTRSKQADDSEDLVDVLLKIQDQGNLQVPLTDDNIKAIILDTFIAGSETSSTTIEWAMSELMKNPRVMEKAQEEVRRVFGTLGDVDESRLHELNYLKLVVKEALRLHAPVPLLLPRECREKCSIYGYEIPVKSRVMVNVWAIGRDPNYWNEPDKFIPERFTQSSLDYKGTNFEYLPFGAGRRMCPGVAYGMMNVEYPLAQLLFHFDWKLPTGVTPENLDMLEYFGSVMKRKNDLHLIPIPYRH